MMMRVLFTIGIILVLAQLLVIKELLPVGEGPG